MKALRYGIYALLVLVALALVGAGVFIATFDPNRYKTELEAWVLEKTGRVLKLEGDIAVSIYPHLGATIGRAWLSEPRENQNQPFVSIDAAHVSVALLPLLQGQTLVNGIEIVGLHAKLVRDKGGKLNIDDLLGRTLSGPAKSDQTTPSGQSIQSATATKSSELQVDIASVRLEKAAIHYEDLAQKQSISITDFNLDTGRIAPISEGPLRWEGHVTSQALGLDVRTSLKAQYQLNLPDKTLSLSDLKVTLKGDVAPWRELSASASAQAKLDWGSQQITLASVSLEGAARQTDSQLTANIQSSKIKMAALFKDDPYTAQGDGLVVAVSMKQPTRDINIQMLSQLWRANQGSVSLPAFELKGALNDRQISATPMPISLKGAL